MIFYSLDLLLLKFSQAYPNHIHMPTTQVFNPYAADCLISPIQNDAKSWKMTETLAYGYSSESTQQVLFNECQHDGVQMVFKNLCVLVLWTKVVLALEGLDVSLVLSNQRCAEVTSIKMLSYYLGFFQTVGYIMVRKKLGISPILVSPHVNQGWVYWMSTFLEHQLFLY